MTGILTPPRIFIDTCHLSNLLRVQRGEGVPNDDDGVREGAYARLQKWMRSGAATVVLCESLISEWIRHKDPSRPFKYANLLDSAACVVEFPPMPGVPLAEVLNECGRVHPELDLKQFKIMRALSVEDPLLVFLSKHHPDMKVTTLGHLDKHRPPGLPPKVTVALKIRMYLQLARLDGGLWKVGVEGDRIAFETTKATQAAFSIAKIYDDDTLRYWMLKALSLEKVLRSVLPDCDPADLVSQVCPTRCPGTLLYYRAYDKYVRARERYYDPHDFIDQTFVAGLAYCDVAIVDKRVREFVTQGQRNLGVKSPEVVSDARLLVEAVARLIGEGP